MKTSYIDSIVKALNECTSLVWESKTGEDLNQKLKIINKNSQNLSKALWKTEHLKDKLNEYKVVKEKHDKLKADLESVINQLHNLVCGETEEEQEQYQQQRMELERLKSTLMIANSELSSKVETLKIQIDKLISEILELDIKEISDETLDNSSVSNGPTKITVVAGIEKLFTLLDNIEEDDSNIGSLYDNTIPEDYSSLVGEVFDHLTSGMQTVTNQLRERVTRAVAFLNKIGVGEGIEAPVIEEYQIPVVEERIYTGKSEEPEEKIEDLKVEEKIQEYEVQPGDSLWKIALKYYDNPNDYVKIVEANPSIVDPDMINVGMKLVIPNISKEVEPEVKDNKDDIEVSKPESEEEKNEPLSNEDVTESSTSDPKPENDSQNTPSNSENKSENDDGNKIDFSDVDFVPGSNNREVYENGKKVSAAKSEHAFEIDQYIYDKAIERGMSDSEARVAVSISRWETGHYTSSYCRNKNNPGGITNGGYQNGFRNFETPEEGIDAFLKLLDENYFTNDDVSDALDYLEKMESVYCGDGSAWAEGVEAIYHGYVENSNF